MQIKPIAQLFVDVKNNATGFYNLRTTKEVTIACAVIVLEGRKEDTTVTGIASLAGYERRDTLNRLNAMTASGHLIKVEGAGRTPDMFYMDNERLRAWMVSKEGKQTLTMIKRTIAQATVAFIER